MRAALLILALALSGCSTMRSTDGFIACKAADIATTVALVESGRGREANPLFAEQTNKGNYLPLIGMGLAAWWLLDKAESEHANLFVNSVTCGVAANNARIYMR